MWGGGGVDLYTLSPCMVCWFAYLVWWQWGRREGGVEGLTCTLCLLRGHPAGLFVYFGEGGGGEKEG